MSQRRDEHGREIRTATQKPGRCCACKGEIPLGSDYRVRPNTGNGGTKKLCDPCAEKEAMPKPEIVPGADRARGDLDGVPFPPGEIGFGRNQGDSIADLMELTGIELDMVKIEKACETVPDLVVRHSILALAEGQRSAMCRAQYDKASGAWMTYPDHHARAKCASMLLSYRVGSPVQRVVTKTVEAETQEQKLRRALLSEETMGIYAEYGVYAGNRLRELVVRCGGDPEMIPAPRRSFKG